MTTYRSKKVDRAAVLNDQKALRRAIFTLGLYMPDMTLSLNDVAVAFDLDREQKHRAWTEIKKLQNKGYFKVVGVKNRAIQYQVATA